MQQQSAATQPGSPMSPLARQHSAHNTASGTLPRPGPASRLPTLRPGPQGSAGDSPPPSRGGRSPGSTAARSLNALLLGSAAKSGQDAELHAHHAAAPPSPQRQWQQQHQQPPTGVQLDEAPTVNSIDVLRDPAAIRAAAAELADRRLAESLAEQQRQEAGSAHSPDSGQQHRLQQQHHQQARQQQHHQQLGGAPHEPAAAAAHMRRPHATLGIAQSQENVLALKLTVVSGPSTDASYVTAKDTRQVPDARSLAQDTITSVLTMLLQGTALIQSLCCMPSNLAVCTRHTVLLPSTSWHAWSNSSGPEPSAAAFLDLKRSL